MTINFHEKLKQKIHELITIVYTLAKKFPKDELYGITTQLKRAAISIMLNYVEGYGRRKKKVQLNFLETSYGSLQEAKYIIYFAYTQKWLSEKEFTSTTNMTDELGKMLWGTIIGLEKRIESSPIS